MLTSILISIGYGYASSGIGARYVGLSCSTSPFWPLWSANPARKRPLFEVNRKWRSEGQTDATDPSGTWPRFEESPLWCALLRSPGNHRFGIWERQVHRRAFLAAGGCTAVATLAATTGGPNLLFARDRTPSSDALEQRIADVIAAFDAQGNHRTGTPVDKHQQNGWRDRYSNWAPSLSSNPSRSAGLIRNRLTCASRIGALTEYLYSTLPSPTGKECAVDSDL
jgi:hypothetical protein